MWPGLALTRSASAKAGDESINLRAKCVGNTMNFIGGDRNLLHDGIARPGFFVELGNEVCHLDIGGGGSPARSAMLRVVAACCDTDYAIISAISDVDATTSAMTSI